MSTPVTFRQLNKIHKNIVPLDYGHYLPFNYVYQDFLDFD